MVRSSLESLSMISNTHELCTSLFTMTNPSTDSLASSAPSTCTSSRNLPRKCGVITLKVYYLVFVCSLTEDVSFYSAYLRRKQPRKAKLLHSHIQFRSDYCACAQQKLSAMAGKGQPPTNPLIPRFLFSKTQRE